MCPVPIAQLPPVEQDESASQVVDNNGEVIAPPAAAPIGTAAAQRSKNKNMNISVPRVASERRDESMQKYTASCRGGGKRNADGESGMLGVSTASVLKQRATPSLILSPSRSPHPLSSVSNGTLAARTCRHVWTESKHLKNAINRPTTTHTHTHAHTRTHTNTDHEPPAVTAIAAT